MTAEQLQADVRAYRRAKAEFSRLTGKIRRLAAVSADPGLVARPAREVQRVWRELEEIKNRHGGMPPEGAL